MPWLNPFSKLLIFSTCDKKSNSTYTFGKGFVINTSCKDHYASPATNGCVLLTIIVTEYRTIELDVIHVTKSSGGSNPH
jgi:hypothetical protein